MDISESDNLLPCPFCGAAPMRCTGVSGRQLYFCAGHTNKFLVDDWNRRAPEPPAAAQGPSLADALDDLTAAHATLTACIDERDEALAALFRLAGKGVIHSPETWVGAIAEARTLLARHDRGATEPTGAQG